MAQVTDDAIEDGRSGDGSLGNAPSSDDPFEAGCYALAVRRAARAVTAHYDAALKPTGLRITQLGVLHAVSIRQPVALTDLSARLGMDRTTLKRNLGPLIRDDLVRLEGAPGDRRSRIVSTTEGGDSLLARAIPLWERAQEQLAAGFGAERAARLRADLHALAATEPTPPNTTAPEPRARPMKDNA